MICTRSACRNRGRTAVRKPLRIRRTCKSPFSIVLICTARRLDSGERQYKSSPLKRRFDPALRSGGSGTEPRRVFIVNTIHPQGIGAVNLGRGHTRQEDVEVSPIHSRTSPSVQLKKGLNSLWEIVFTMSTLPNSCATPPPNA